MRKQGLYTGIWAWVLGFMVGFSSVACLLTAFDLYEAEPVTLALYCIFSGILCSACAKGRWVLIPAGVLALALGHLWRSGLLEWSVESLLYRLARFYSVAYTWETVQWTGRSVWEMSETLPPILYLMGFVITGVTAVSVGRASTCMPAVLLAMLPLGACMLVTDRVPATQWLFLLLAGLALLLLTGPVRRQYPAMGNRLTGILLIPICLVALCMFLLNPREEYDMKKYANKYADTIFSSIQSRFLELTGQTPAVGISVDGNIVDLRNVGYRGKSKSEVMRVTPTDYTGTVYLRGRSLDYYDGVTWTNRGEGADLEWPGEGYLDSAGELVISTRYAHRMLYLPYYTTSMDLNGTQTGIENKEKLTMYSVSFTETFDAEFLEFYYQGKYPMKDYSCTQLPEQTQTWAKELADEICGDLQSPYAKAKAIVEYVRSSAVYDLSTDKMPAGRTDFVKWFLESSDTGYCVHFATATTVLLKAAGLPARYVTGYAVKVKESNTTVVRVSDAHAWAECWLPGLGWVPLESTPADLSASDTTDDPRIPDQDEPEPDPVPEPEPEPQPEPDEDHRQEQDQNQEDSQENTGDSQTGVSATTQKKKKNLMWLFVTLGGLMLAAAVILQRYLRLYFRIRKLKKGEANQRALQHWQYLCRLWRYTGQEPPEEIQQLAEKAKFSQFTLTREELKAFEDREKEARQTLRKRSIFKRFWYTTVLVLY